MCISVDLPEPDGPMTADELAGAHVERDAAKRLDGGLALAVDARHVGCDDDAARLPGGCGCGFFDGGHALQPRRSPGGPASGTIRSCPGDSS